MSTITFDKVASVDSLKDAGIPEVQERNLKIWFGKMMAWQLGAVAGLLAIATAVVKLF